MLCFRGGTFDKICFDRDLILASERLEYAIVQW
jgi:hypothetical protein